MIKQNEQTELLELGEEEMEHIEGGTFMETVLDSWLGAMSGGYVGYSNGSVTYGTTLYKNSNK